MQRVADEIQKSLALLIQRNMKDPRIGFVTISSVKVSKDFSFADVYLSWLNLDEESECLEALEVIRKASGYLRTQLAKDIRLRVIPKLRFHHDKSIVNGMTMSKLIDDAISREAPKSNEDKPDTPNLDNDI